MSTDVPILGRHTLLIHDSAVDVATEDIFPLPAGLELIPTAMAVRVGDWLKLEVEVRPKGSAGSGPLLVIIT